jgi:hypothetical protein
MRKHGIAQWAQAAVSSVLMVSLLLCSPKALHARTWHVPSECPTIHAGLDSAAYGDTVLVAPGTYLKTDDPETWIHPGSGVRLVGEGGPEATIIEFCNSSTGIKLSQCEGARVSGFTIRFGSGPGCWAPPGLTYGIRCTSCTDVIVDGCIIENAAYGIYVEGKSSQWWKPVFRDNVIRNCGPGIGVFDGIDAGRPYFQANTITSCTYGTEIRDSSPMFDGNTITYCRDFGMYYMGDCGGSCYSNVIAHNGMGVAIYADPPLAAPDFNGSWELDNANDFFDNGGVHISYTHSSGQGFVMALYNYWGSRCPDSSAIFQGTVIFEPWVDSTHEQVLNRTNCTDAAEPSTWGAIKAMFK